MSDQFFHGSPLLMGDGTVPGVKIPEELAVLLPKIWQSVKDYGCDCYPSMVEMLTYDEISEMASYGGFPVRYPHWQWGMEYEELQRGYEHGMHRIYEMVVNSNPCYIYCLDSNTLIDNITVVSHALFHNDFFKNNVFFEKTNQNMMNQLADNGMKIRQYMARWGREKVGSFIDNILRMETLIDPANAWKKKTVRDVVMVDKRTYRRPNRVKVQEGHEYMHDYLNPSDWRQEQDQKIADLDAIEELNMFQEPTKDILGFLRDNAPLTTWQQDIVAILHEESLYFAPQRTTKMMNEGWASFGDSAMMTRLGLCELEGKGPGGGVVEYATHKAGVLGGKYSANPYKLGYMLFCDIEERWNKGRFGDAWDNCDNAKMKEDWDMKLGLGKQKVFEVRRDYNDVTALLEFFTEDFAKKNDYFEWKKYPTGEYKIMSRDFAAIKKKIVQRYMNGGLPDIRLVDPNYRGKGVMALQHMTDGRGLLRAYTEAVLESICNVWKNDVFLATKNKDGEEIVFLQRYSAVNDLNPVEIMTRKQFETTY